MTKLVTRILLSLALSIMLGATTVSAATFTVDDTGDASDADAGNGVCATGGGVCTLRAAIEEANASGGADVIEFSVGSGQITISPGSFYDDISEQITIDGTSQPGYSGSPIVKIDGTSAGDNACAFTADINGSDHVFNGLVLVNFDECGIYSNFSSNVTVTNSYIGVDFDGETAASNTAGIIFFQTTGGVIGGSNGDGNVVSGNTSTNIEIGTGSTGIEVSGNNVGTNFSADDVVSGNGRGILVKGGATIGGTTFEKRNVISGNTTGLWLFGDVAVNVQGNYIGTDQFAQTAIPNSAVGVYLTGSNAVVGGEEDSKRNYISGNSGNGIALRYAGTTDNTIQNNHIGIDDLGADLGNTSNGIEIYEDAAGNTFDNNVISGNGANGIYKRSTVDGDIITNNYIGVSDDGETAVKNDGYGIYITGGSATIGTNGNGNVIAGHTSFEVYLNGTTANETTIKGNKIGVSVGEDLVVGAGIYSANTEDLVIGGTIEGEGNTIAGHTTAAISALGGSGHTIQGNFIGTDSGGNGWNLGNSGTYGIALSSSDTVIGGSIAGQNTISNMDTAGVYVSSTSVTGVEITYNLIYDNLNADGILLAGEDGNDDDDSDSGANGALNYPYITTVTYGDDVRVQGSYQGAATTDLTVHVCADTTALSTAFGQCSDYIGNFEITTDGDGAATFDETFIGKTVAADTKMSSYAVDDSSNTSQFGSDLNTAYESAQTIPASTYTINSDSELVIALPGLSDDAEVAVILQPDNASYFNDSQDLNYYVNSGGTLSACVDNDCTGADQFESGDFPLTVTGLSDLTVNNPSYYLQLIKYPSYSNYPNGHSPVVSIRPNYWELFDGSYTAIQTSYENGNTINFQYRNTGLANDGTTGGTTSAVLITDAGDSETITLTEVSDSGIYRGSISTSQTASPTGSNGTLEGTAGGTTTATLSVNITTDFVTILDDIQSYADSDMLSDVWTFAGAGATWTLGTNATKYIRAATTTSGNTFSSYKTAAAFFNTNDPSFDGSDYTLSLDVRVNDTTLLDGGMFKIPPRIFNDFEYFAILLQDSSSKSVRKNFADTAFTNNEFVTISAEFDCDDDFESGTFGDCPGFDFSNIAAVELAAYTDTGGDELTIDIDNIVLQKSTNTVDSSTSFTATSTQSPGINRSALTSGTIAEGETDTFTVVLLSDPGVDVTITVGTDAQSSASPSVLTFTSGNYSTPQTVTMTAVDDSEVELETHTSTISFIVSAASGAYSSATLDDMTLNITDNDTSGNPGSSSLGGDNDNNNTTEDDDSDTEESSIEEEPTSESESTESSEASNDENGSEETNPETEDSKTEDKDEGSFFEKLFDDKEEEYEEKTIDVVETETKSDSDGIDNFLDSLVDNNSDVDPDESEGDSATVTFESFEEEREYKCTLEYNVKSFEQKLRNIEKEFNFFKDGLIKERRRIVRDLEDEYKSIIKGIKQSDRNKEEQESVKNNFEAEVIKIENEYDDQIEALKLKMKARVATIESDIDAVNAQIETLDGRCVFVKVNTNIDFNADSDRDGLPDYFERILGIDDGNGISDSDYDGDGIDDVAEVFLTFTNVKEVSDDSFTIGVTGQRSSDGSNKIIKSAGKVSITGSISQDNNVRCYIENSDTVFESSCNERLVKADNDIYMLEVDPGVGEHTIRIEDNTGTITRYDLEISDGYQIGSPKLYDFAGLKNNSFEYIEDNKVVVNPSVGTMPATTVDPTGCVAFGQCIVQAKWNSLIFSSVLLADSSAGRVVVVPPKELEPGEHRLLLTTIDTETNEISDSLEVNFVVDEKVENVSAEQFSLNRDQVIIVVLIFALAGSFGYRIRRKNRVKDVAQKLMQEYNY